MPRLPAFGVLLFLLLLLGFVLTARPALALSNPQQFYDWNTYNQTQVLGIKAFAQEGTPSAQATPTTPTATNHHDYLQHNYFLGFVSNFTPASPFYFVKRVEESTTLTFTFNPQVREEKRLEIAGERLHEIEEMAKQGNVQALEGLARSYQTEINRVAENLEALKNQGQDVSSLASSVDLECAKQKLVLEEVRLQTPAQAGDQLQTAIQASEKAVDTVADVSGKPAVPQDVVQALQAHKALGLLSEEEVNKIVAAPTRVDAREELRKFENEGIVSNADLLKFDETAQKQFPQAFFTSLEVKKFEELKRLETQKPDDATLQRVQEFAKDYKTGDVVPTDIRKWWAPLVKLEELQNTIRPDLIPQDSFRNRPEDLQKYQEVVERIKPTQKDVKYVDNLIRQNPNLLNDPSYARIKALADKFGSSELPSPISAAAQACGRGTHWVTIPFMPTGGYCVPNYDFPAPGGNTTTQSCPAGYHRASSESACYADSPETAAGRGGFNVASGSCPSGYGWVPEHTSSSGGYCAPRGLTDGGAFPSPIYTIGYCLPGQTFRDGKCETYNPPPAQGCPSGSWWNGSSCIQQKSCDQGYYQDYSGECKKASETHVCVQPPGGCGFNAYWDSSACSCKSTLDYPTPAGTSCKNPPTCTTGQYLDYASCSCKSGDYPSPGGGTQDTKAQCESHSGCSWTGSYCNCSGGYPSPTGPYQTPSYPTPSGDHNCGPGYYWNGSYCVLSGSNPSSPTSGSTNTNCGSGYSWNGSYCAPSSGGGGSGTYTPSETHDTSSYPTPSYSYPSPSYGTPESYPSPSYGSPSYGSPSYGTPESYPTPSGEAPH